MIVELLLEMIFNVFDLLTRVISIPAMPQEMNYYITVIGNYFAMGAGVVATYTPWQYMLVLFGFVVYVDVGYSIYRLVMWVLNKVPFVDVD